MQSKYTAVAFSGWDALAGLCFHDSFGSLLWEEAQHERYFLVDGGADGGRQIHRAATLFRSRN